MARSAVLAKVLGKDVDHTGSVDQDAAIDQAMAVAQEALRAAPIIDPYLARTAQHRQTIDRSLADAVADKDGKTVAALIGVDLKGLELDARLTNRLDNRPAGPDLTIQLMVGIPRHSPTVDVQCKAITGPSESD